MRKSLLIAASLSALAFAAFGFSGETVKHFGNSVSIVSAKSLPLLFGTLQLSVAARNAMLDAIETTGGTSVILTIRTGAPPANCATANSGTVLATINCPSDWMGAASAGVKSKSGTWQDTSADASGTAAHFRIHDSGGTNCLIQGTVTATGGGGDMTVDNTSFAAAQNFTVTAFDLTGPNA